MLKIRLFLLASFSLLFLLPQAGKAQVVASGNIDLQQVSNNPSNPTGICQCDTIRIRYEIKPGANFSATSTFEYQLANPSNQWGTAINLSLVRLLTAINPDVPATSILDTIGTGLKWADLAIPCNANLFGATLRIVNKDVNNNIVPGGASDTAYYNVNRIPTVALIDSAYMISNQMVMDTFENPYTTTVTDIGFCDGDTVVLRVNNDGNSYQWFNGSAMVGTDADSLIVTGTGLYRCEVFDGPCSIESNSIQVTLMNTPTAITFNGSSAANANAFQVDNPIPSNLSPRDSVEICNNASAFFRGPTPVPATGLTFTYQWLTDSLNPVTGLREIYPVAGATQANLTVSSANSRPGRNAYWLEVFDGFCSDTTANPYYVFVDTIPRAQVAGIPFPGFTGDTSFVNVCMRDSVLLSALPPVLNPEWTYQWQWYDPSVPAGANPWKSVSGQPAGALSFDTLPTIAIDTSLSDPGQPYFQNPKPHLRYFRVRINNRTQFNRFETCVFFSDSIGVRWFPEYSLQLAGGQPSINLVGRDSINFCEGDTAAVLAPATPADLQSFGFNYTYQWLSDSLDTITNTRVRFPLTGETAQVLRIADPGRYFVVLDDGICTDTSQVYRVFVDTIPETTISEVRFPGGGGLTNLNLCLYDSALVSAGDTVLGLRPWNYQWQLRNPNTGLWLDLNNDTLVTLRVDNQKIPAQDTAYIRLQTTYFNQFGLQVCDFTSDSLEVIFYESPTVSYIPGDSIGICPGDSVLVVAQGNFTSFSWQNGQVLGASRYINLPGQYPVEAVGVNSCVTEDTVIVFPLTVNAAAGPDQQVLSGELVQLSAFGGTNYRWFANKPLEFSDRFGQSITVTKTLDDGVNADTITIYVEVTNTRGCSGLDSLLLIVRRNLPDNLGTLSQTYNIITPNGDGLNDIWDITELLGGDQCRLVVLNRWGSTVFEDESFSGQWDGTDNGGNELPDGTYYYLLDCNGEIRMRNALTIIRNQ